jgi:hypothetical protein
MSCEIWDKRYENFALRKTEKIIKLEARNLNLKLNNKIKKYKKKHESI